MFGKPEFLKPEFLTPQPVKPDSAANDAPAVRAGEIMDALREPVSARGGDPLGGEAASDERGAERGVLRNDNERASDGARRRPVEIAPEPASLARVPESVAFDRPSRAEAEAAVRTLLRWAGDDPDREGLADTPARVVKAYEQLYSGYGVDADALLARVFEEVEGYSEIVVLRDIPFYSHCEHHMVPFSGVAHIAYYPAGGVVGLSKLARIVDTFARRLQTQETMTAQIADVVETILKPRGVAVMLEAEHLCMAMRGVQKAGVSTVTTQFRGVFKDDPNEQVRFITLTRGRG